jgi:hypothetical protein
VAAEVKRSHFVLGSDQNDFRSKDVVEKHDQNWNVEVKKAQTGVHSSK